jgi:hypothetical protein
VYEDPVSGDLRLLYYQLTAMNRFGGESSRTEPVRAVTKAEPLPPIALELRGRRLGFVELSWARNVERDVVSYGVWRARSTDGSFKKEERIGAVEPPEVEFEDREVGCAERVRYRVRAVDADGLLSDFSRPLEVVGADLGTRIDLSDGVAIVRWDPGRAEGWTGARVYRSRRLFQDALLGEGLGVSEMPLPALPPGKHELSLVLTRPPTRKPRVTIPGATPALELAPACRIELTLD